MSLACGNCRKILYDAYGVLYLLEREAGKLIYPHEVQRDFLNSAVCPTCWELVPDTEKKLIGDAAKEAASALSDPLYVFAWEADVGRPDGRAHQMSEPAGPPCEDHERMVFLTHEVVERYIPKTLDAIEQDRRNQEWGKRSQAVDRDHLSRVIKFLEETGVKVREMTEFTPGVVGVHSNQDEEEFSIYFNPECFSQRQPWLGPLCLPFTKAGFDVLTGRGLQPPASDEPSLTNMDQTAEYAQRYLVRQNGEPWELDLMDFIIPSALRVEEAEVEVAS